MNSTTIPTLKGPIAGGSDSGLQEHRLRGVDVNLNAISDNEATLAAIAPFARSPATIRNVAHIGLKETDRIATVAKELNRLKIRVEECASGITNPAQSIRCMCQSH